MGAIHLQNPGHPSSFLQKANQMRLSGTLCDVVIMVDSQEFHAHRIVLACASKMFEILFPPQQPTLYSGLPLTKDLPANSGVRLHRHATSQPGGPGRPAVRRRDFRDRILGGAMSEDFGNHPGVRRE